MQAAHRDKAPRNSEDVLSQDRPVLGCFQLRVLLILMRCTRVRFASVETKSAPWFFEV